MSFYSSLYLVVPLSLAGAMVMGNRHFMSYVLLLELSSVAILIGLAVYCPHEWLHLVTFVLVMSVGEGAVGLSVMVKISRCGGDDRVALFSLLLVGKSFDF